MCLISNPHFYPISIVTRYTNSKQLDEDVRGSILDAHAQKDTFVFYHYESILAKVGYNVPYNFLRDPIYGGLEGDEASDEARTGDVNLLCKSCF